MDYRYLLPVLLLACSDDATTATGSSDSATESTSGGLVTETLTTGIPPTGGPTTTPTTTTGPPTTTTDPGTDTIGPGTETDPSEDTGEVECFQCDTFLQDCANGERCVPWSCDGSAGWNGTLCSPIDAAPVGLGETCTMQNTPNSGRDNCERGAMCWDVDEGTLQGECIGLCTGSVDSPGCVDECAECFIPAEGVLNLCFAACDPNVQDCGAGRGCYLFDMTYACAETDAAGTAAGAPCDFPTDCEPGQQCVNGAFVPGCAAGAGCCTPFCDIGTLGSCDEVAGTTCAPALNPGQGPACVPNSIGLCVLP